MLFKNPQLLWSLWLLLIPILVHLLQLRKFKKTPFTNVKLLQKVAAKSQRSQTLKRWLLLITRMALLSCLILAFAQPYFAKETAMMQKETTIYLDNSFSLQSRNGTTTLLEQAVQDLIKSLPEEDAFNLFTNDKEYRDVKIGDIQNDLLQLEFTPSQLTLDDIHLKAMSFFGEDPNSIKRLVIISDLQQRMNSETRDTIQGIELHYLPIRSENSVNTSIDSVFIDTSNPLNKELMVLLTQTSAEENTSVSLYNGETLIAKSAAEFNNDGTSQLVFTLPQDELIEGKVEISDLGLTYDNRFYFNLNTKDKIKVLTIGSSDDTYLKKIYSGDECEYLSLRETEINVNSIESQDLIVLNELPKLSASLQAMLRDYLGKGGSLVLIPGNDIDVQSYNALIGTNGLRVSSKTEAERDITTIHFSHPLFKNVFEKNSTNFQYPKVNSFYGINKTAQKILSYENNDPFLVGSRGLYLFSAQLDISNSNFQSSPLVVTTFYAMALSSLKLPAPYYILGRTAAIDIPEVSSQDRVIKIKKGSYEFIPLQQSIGNKTRLTFQEDPKIDGTFGMLNTNTERKLSFNYPRDESKLVYLDLNTLSGTLNETNIPDLFEAFEKDNTVTMLWKWFVILALLFILTEIIIQKVFK